MFAIAFTVLPGVDFWHSKLKNDEPLSYVEVKRQLFELYEAENFNGLQSLLLKIEGRPELANESYFYSLYLATINPGYKGATPPDFYFEKIDPGSMKYGQAIRHISSYYLGSAGSWSAAKPQFIELSKKIDQSGRILPQKFFVDLMAMGPNPSYDDLHALYKRIVESYGRDILPESGTVFLKFDVKGPAPLERSLEVLQVPSLLLLLYQEMAIAAARECREEERKQAAKLAKDVAAGPMFDNDQDRISSFADKFFAAAFILTEQQKRLSEALRRTGNC